MLASFHPDYERARKLSGPSRMRGSGARRAGGPLAYRFVGLSLANISFSNPTSAFVDTTYSIPSSNNSGAVSFSFANQGVSG